MDKVLEILNSQSGLALIRGDHQAHGELYRARRTISDTNQNLFYNESVKPKLLCIDFDGCISQYREPWTNCHTIRDNPVDGAFSFIKQAVLHFRVIIFSCRCNTLKGREAVKMWLIENNLKRSVVEQLHFQPGKPPAAAFIDDRSIRFNGDWGELSPLHILNNRNWNPWWSTIKDWKRK